MTTAEVLKKIDEKDHYTYGHSIRVSYFSKLLAESCGLSDKEIAEIEEAALLHDTGKLMVADEVLNKAGKLTDEEFEKIKAHPYHGMTFLKNNYENPSAVVLAVAGGHHMSVNGTGYGVLSDNEIPLAVQIVSIADMFDGIASKRVYRDSVVPVAKVLDIMKEEKKCNEELLTIFVEKVVPSLNIHWMRTDTEALPCVA